MVFTLPHQLNPLCLRFPDVLYKLLFDTTWSVINSFGKDPKWLGAQAGMVSILHTWGQTLSLHPHLHCIIPGGCITKQGSWKRAKSSGKYLFNVTAMSTVFRGRYIAALKKALPEEVNPELINALYNNKWVVYAKRAFGGPKSVVEYLGRYTHKIAISNHRIKETGDGRVRFAYKDYTQQGAHKEMDLEGMEFLRRFSLHILPKGFVRIRHYGFLGSSGKYLRIEKNWQQLKPINPCKAAPEEPRGSHPFNPTECPVYKKVTMQRVMLIRRRGPPAAWKEQAEVLLECINEQTARSCAGLACPTGKITH